MHVHIHERAHTTNPPPLVVETKGVAWGTLTTELQPMASRVIQ